MASDYRARWVSIPFQVGDRFHGFRMTYGTAQALGISDELIGNGFKETSVAGHTTTRRLYPGGPVQTVSVPTRLRQVPVGPGSGKARTNKKLIIKGGGPHEMATVYHSGALSDAVAWLKANANISGGGLAGGFQIYSPTGKPLTTVVPGAPAA